MMLSIIDVVVDNYKLLSMIVIFDKFIDGKIIDEETFISLKT